MALHWRMNTTAATEPPPVNPSTPHARRHRQRRRERLPTVELPNEVIHAIITRGLVNAAQAAQRADAWTAIQDCYAALKRLSELD
jgi:hypothetical protein